MGAALQCAACFAYGVNHRTTPHVESIENDIRFLLYTMHTGPANLRDFRPSDAFYSVLYIPSAADVLRICSS